MTQHKRIIMHLRNEYGEGNDNVKLVVDALERQIPKRPKYEDADNIYGAMKRTCTNCGDVVMVSPQARPFELYCRYCGTRLVDWTEDNE